MKCLYVDDNEDLLEISKEFLEQIDEKLEIITTNSVSKAFEIMESQKLDGIVSDYQMYPTNGLEFLKIIREKGNTIPFIIFTGRGGSYRSFKLRSRSLFTERRGCKVSVWCSCSSYSSRNYSLANSK